MKRTMILAMTLLSCAAVSGAVQRPTKAPVKRIAVSAQATARRPVTLDLTHNGAIYTLAAGVDYNRVVILTSKGKRTMADLLKGAGRPVSGQLRVGTTRDLRSPMRGTIRPQGVAENYECSGLACTCKGPDSDDCKDLFASNECGPIASCDENGCFCFRI